MLFTLKLDSSCLLILSTGAFTYGGGINEKVLIQEYADGEEYAVDTVSMDGTTKAVALWKYHKIPINGAPFVYQCTELVPISGPVEEKIVQVSAEIEISFIHLFTKLLWTASFVPECLAMSYRPEL